jgi:hypothetical protein
MILITIDPMIEAGSHTPKRSKCNVTAPWLAISSSCCCEQEYLGTAPRTQMPVSIYVSFGEPRYRSYPGVARSIQVGGMYPSISIYMVCRITVLHLINLYGFQTIQYKDLKVAAYPAKRMCSHRATAWFVTLGHTYEL